MIDHKESITVETVTLLNFEDVQDFKFKFKFKNFKFELWKQLKLAAPIAAINLLNLARVFITSAWFQEIGVALALTYANLTGYSVLTGISIGLEAEISQAFGAGRFDIIHSTLTMGVFISVLAGFAITIVWFQVENFMSFFFSERDTFVSHRFLVYLIPDLLLQAILHPVSAFLRSQCRIRELLIANIVGFLVHLALLFGFGAPFVAYGAIAICISDLMVLLALFLQDRSHWKSLIPKFECSPKTGDLLRLVLGSCLGFCTESWFYEALLIISAAVGTDSFSAASVVLDLDAVLYALASAVSTTASIRVGNELGLNSPCSACDVVLSSSISSVLLGCVGLVLSFSRWWRLLGTREVTQTIVPVVALVEFWSPLKTVLCGLLIGSGRTMAVAIASVGSWFAVGLPIGFCLGFMGFGMYGIWIGLLAAVVSCVVFTGMAVMSTDWIELAKCVQWHFKDEQDEYELDKFNDDDTDTDTDTDMEC